LKTAIAVLAVIALAAFATLALYQGVRWLTMLRARRGRVIGFDAELVRLRDERRRLLNHLREIEFDFQTGKLDASDHKSLRNRYEREAVQVIEALDRLQAERREAATRNDVDHNGRPA